MLMEPHVYLQPEVLSICHVHASPCVISELLKCYDGVPRFALHVNRYRTAVEDVPLGMYTIPLGKARLLSQGTDITLVGWGQQVLVLQQAAHVVRQSHGITCDVIDLRTLVPWDVETVEASVNKTGRLIVSHEAPLTSRFVYCYYQQ